jgi:LysM domain
VKRLLFVMIPSSALAQPNTGLPTYPSDAPTTLSPSVGGNQAPPTPAPAPAQGGGPSVITVGPDGKVTNSAPGPEDTRFYISSGDPGSPQPESLHVGPTPELHVVRRGDTLWDICFFYFNDPWQWPKIWSYNAQVTNPHWIYPGDLVRLLPRGAFVQASGPAEPNPNPDAIDPVPAPAKRTDVGLKTTAFVEKADLEQGITIDGAVDEKQLLTTGDQVYLSYPKNKQPQVGKKFSIYVPGQPVKGYGAYVRLLGTLEVLSVKEDKRARAIITDANYEIERGAKVGPLVTKFKNVPNVAPSVDAQAPIVAMLANDQLIGQGEIVFVALGRKSGVQIGNRMYVVRRGDAYPEKMSNEIGSDDRRFPARSLGEVVIVEVGDNISIGLVTLAVQEMSIGDLVMMQKQ